MFSRPTTFVIGAGASYELNLPTGEGLQVKIAELLRWTRDPDGFVNEEIANAVNSMMDEDKHYDLTSWITAGAKIIAGMPTAASIDNFLHSHSDDRRIVRLGKLAIAKAIIDAEARSHVRSGDFSGVGIYNPYSSKQYKRSWYYPFIKMLSMGTLPKNPRTMLQNVNFIVFNYDRCLELILRNALKTYFTIGDREAADIISESVEIIHPYGSLGPLPREYKGVGTPFGGSGVDLSSVASGIKTFTEAVESDVVARAMFHIENADVLVFMGFGFLAQNVDLIAPSGNRQATRVHATTHGFSETDKLIIADQLKRFIRPVDASPLVTISTIGKDRNRSFIDVENSSCRVLVDSHRMRLMEG